MKLLALDIGEKRIGLASGVAELGTALPAGFLERTRLKADIRSVLNAARQRQTDAIVVGIPWLPGGGESHQTGQVKGFIRALKKETALPVYVVDEAFTSVEADGLLRDAGMEPSRNRGAVDEAAAVLILRRFLETLPGDSNQPGP